MEYDSVEFKGSLTDVCMTDWLYDWRDDHISMRLTYYTSDCLTVCITDWPHILMIDWLNDKLTNWLYVCMIQWLTVWLTDCMTDGIYVRLTVCTYDWQYVCTYDWLLVPIIFPISYHIYTLIKITVSINHFVPISPSIYVDHYRC